MCVTDITVEFAMEALRDFAKKEAVTDQNKVKKASPKVVNKIGRNEKCTCGSGKKYKQCCGK